MTNKNGADETLSSFTYTYAADGNILTEVANTGTTETTTYTYDLLGRLIAEVGNAGTRFYTYDTAGNRTQAIVDTDTTVCYTYNSDGELISESSNNGATSETTLYEYDANGNLTKKTKGISVTNYAYDVWGNMVSADNATYAYNAQGLRVSKTVGGETDSFTLVGGNVWADSDTAYFRGIELVSNGTQLYLYNVRGDVIQLLGFDGDVDKTYDYDAYGNELQRDLNDENPFRYCGEYYDTETGFIYLRARYYNPMVGRFTSVDPAKDGLNWYAYCEGNPIMYTDPSGLKKFDKKYYEKFYEKHFNKVSRINWFEKKSMESLLKQTLLHNNQQNVEIEGIFYDQSSDELDELMYGKYKMSDTGCGPLAMYNALQSLEVDVSLNDVIAKSIESYAIVSKGKLGTNPYKIPDVLNEYGVESDKIAFDDISDQGIYIVTYITEDVAAHIICIRVFDNGGMSIYNLASDLRCKDVHSEISTDDVIISYRVYLP